MIQLFSEENTITSAFVDLCFMKRKKNPATAGLFFK
jgi:hypothetical protein